MIQFDEVKKPLDPKQIPKYENHLFEPDVLVPSGYDGTDDKQIRKYTVDICKFKQQILPEPLPPTTVLGYGGSVRDRISGKAFYTRSSPGPTFEIRQGERIKVRWRNRLRICSPFAVDPTLHWANPNDMPAEPPRPWPGFPPGFEQAQYPIPAVTHLHGGTNPPEYDGHPDAWFTSDGKHGPAFAGCSYVYNNTQEPATLWYHDHTLGLTRLNVYGGLCGFYLLRENEGQSKRMKGLCGQGSLLPEGDYDIPLAIQDRSFYADGSLAFTARGVNPDIHPYWSPGFLGDVITVNGKAWPNLDVESCLYRFHILNASNERFYELSFSNGMPFYQIGTDGGYLEKPAELYSLLLAPAERADILVDFSGLRKHEKVLLLNTANAPYPFGGAPDPETVGQIMRFTVCSARPCAFAPSLPIRLNSIPRLKPDAPRRILTLHSLPGANGPAAFLLNGLKWDAPVTESPRVGATEDWFFVNLTQVAHPIHLHLVQFNIASRRPFDAEAYDAQWRRLNGGILPLDHPPATLPFEGYVLGPARSPEANERGWKDTVAVLPGEITQIRVRFAPQDVPVSEARPGLNLFPFDPAAKPGYVWHCHILDHEDNEMMRPFIVDID